MTIARSTRHVLFAAPVRAVHQPFASSTFAFLIASYVRVASWHLVQPPASGLDSRLALDGVGPAAAGSTALVAVRYVYAAVCAKSKQRNTSPDGRHCSQRRRQLFSVRASSTKARRTLPCLYRRQLPRASESFDNE